MSDVRGVTRPPLRRPPGVRWAGGVCAGVSIHLGVPLRAVRLGWVLLSLAGGAGVLLYVFLWVTVPSGDPYRVAQDARPPSSARLARRLEGAVRQLPVRDVAVGALLLAAAVLLIAFRHDGGLDVSWVVPVLIALAGAGLAWSQLDEVARGRLLSQAGGRTPVGVVRLVGGLLLVLVGVLLLVGQDEPVSVLARSAVAALAVLAGAALVMAPWWLRLVSELGDERAARAREAERADIAAHLHDSVLQTLALIRAAPEDAERVARLARAQERELREWLYDDRPAPGTSVAAEVRAIVAEVEDGRSRGSERARPVAVEVVVVGDCAPTPGTEAVLQAAREALVNAVVHGEPPVSVYVEVGRGRIEVFVRDRGTGFDLESVAPDRFGVRESILGRMRRRGGEAEVVSSPERGTEVRLSMPIAPSTHPAEPS